MDGAGTTLRLPPLIADDPRLFWLFTTDEFEIWYRLTSLEPAFFTSKQEYKSGWLKNIGLSITCFQLEVKTTLPASFNYLKLSKLSFLTFRFQQSMLSENFEWPTISTEKTPPPKLFCPCEKSFSKLFEVVATSSTSFAFLPPPFIPWRRNHSN